MRKPYTIGITGGSGSGKTHFIKEVSAHFKPHELCLISQDHYYKPLEHQIRDENGVDNFDLPSSIEYRLLAADIKKLKKGERVSKSEYHFNKPWATPQELIFIPAPILIVEGLFVQYFDEIDRQLDLKIFIDAKDHIKLTRRIRRDNSERGYDLDDVLYRYQHHVMPVFESLIKPLRDKADLIIPNHNNFKGAVDILVGALRAHI